MEAAFYATLGVVLALAVLAIPVMLVMAILERISQVKRYDELKRASARLSEETLTLMAVMVDFRFSRGIVSGMVDGDEANALWKRVQDQADRVHKTRADVWNRSQP